MTVAQSQAESQEDTGSKWGWVTIIWALTDGDICKVDQVLSMSHIQCLTWLSLRKDMNE
jgi:hypothetical protein